MLLPEFSLWGASSVEHLGRLFELRLVCAHWAAVIDNLFKRWVVVNASDPPKHVESLLGRLPLVRLDLFCQCDWESEEQEENELPDANLYLLEQALRPHANRWRSVSIVVKNDWTTNEEGIHPLITFPAPKLEHYCLAATYDDEDSVAEPGRVNFVPFAGRTPLLRSIMLDNVSLPWYHTQMLSTLRNITSLSLIDECGIDSMGMLLKILRACESLTTLRLQMKIDDMRFQMDKARLQPTVIKTLQHIEMQVMSNDVISWIIEKLVPETATLHVTCAYAPGRVCTGLINQFVPRLAKTVWKSKLSALCMIRPFMHLPHVGRNIGIMEFGGFRILDIWQPPNPRTWPKTRATALIIKGLPASILTAAQSLELHFAQVPADLKLFSEHLAHVRDLHVGAESPAAIESVIEWCDQELASTGQVPFPNITSISSIRGKGDIKAKPESNLSQILKFTRTRQELAKAGRAARIETVYISSTAIEGAEEKLSALKKLVSNVVAGDIVWDNPF